MLRQWEGKNKLSFLLAFTFLYLLLVTVDTPVKQCTAFLFASLSEICIAKCLSSKSAITMHLHF